MWANRAHERLDADDRTRLGMDTVENPMVITGASFVGRAASDVDDPRHGRAYTRT